MLILTLIICVTSLGLSALLWMRFEQLDDRRGADAKEEADKIAEQIVSDIGESLDRLQRTADTMVTGLIKDGLQEDRTRHRLKRVFENNRDSLGLLEAGVAWEPAQNPWRPGRASAPHYGLKDGQPQFFQVEDAYTYQDSTWFKLTADSSRWIEPYFGGATKQVTAGFAVPLYTSPGSRRRAGVARINFDLERFRQIIANAQPLKPDSSMRASYVLLLSRDSLIITHPIVDYSGKSLGSLAKRDRILRALRKPLAERMPDSVIVDSDTGQKYWYFAKRVNSTGWTAVVLLDQEETLDASSTDAEHLGWITVATVFFLCSLLVLLLRAYRGTERPLWWLSVLTSLVFVLGIVATWYFFVTSGSRIDERDVRVLDGAMANAIWRQHEGRFPGNSTSITVPTGVFVQSVRFTGANNVVLTGYVWQRSIAGIDGLPGIIFPEAEEISIEPAYESAGVKGWYFETTLRQQFDYSRYPFDREDVWIRLWPGRFDQRFVLMPDFASYTDLRPWTKPGLERDFVLEGWTVEDSYFSYRTNRYNVNLGQPGFRSDNSLELYFNIGLSRNPVSPFVADIIPLLVVSFLVFAVLMISTRHEERMGILGFSTSAVLAYCAALFFVLIVSHVHLRETLAGQGIIYMEYFYFVMYFAILAVSTNSLLFSSSASLPAIHYRDNLLVKQSYWPVLTAALFAITLSVFVFGSA